ncbi:hypothetical protein [Rhizosaccharibacter radicis]|uniref:Uncharacterized protein n=1 Tax=Rhizosaccharibacter radicis TaxID=2782605 RepID=A0ABT1VWJ6_9PROT|nr:hypothetical protein [Acetobacteraceae bacterium KSS12]
MVDATDALKLELKVENVDLNSLPMEKVGQIIRLLAALTDSKKQVYLESLVSGSVRVACRVDNDAAQMVSARLVEAARVDGGSARAAWQGLDDLLTEINGTGELMDRRAGAVLLTFPGAKASQGALPAFWQAGSLRGQLISLRLTMDGFKGTLMNGGGRDIFEAQKSLAESLRDVLFGYVEVGGRGHWQRGSDSRWRLLRFQATTFRPLKEEGLPALRARLVAAGGFGSGDSKAVRDDLDAIR